MGKIINISDKLTTEHPSIQVGDKVYPVDDSLSTVMKFEELLSVGGTEAMISGMETALGKEAIDELGFGKTSFLNVKVWFLAILAAMQDMTYEQAEARFQESETNK